MKADKSEPTFGMSAITSIANFASPYTTRPNAPIKSNRIPRPTIAGPATDPTRDAAKQTTSMAIRNAVITPTT